MKKEIKVSDMEAVLASNYSKLKNGVGKNSGRYYSNDISGSEDVYTYMDKDYKNLFEVILNRNTPYIAITYATGKEFFMQGQDAGDALKEIDERMDKNPRWAEGEIIYRFVCDYYY